MTNNDQTWLMMTNIIDAHGFSTPSDPFRFSTVTVSWYLGRVAWPRWHSMSGWSGEDAGGPGGPGLVLSTRKPLRAVMGSREKTTETMVFYLELYNIDDIIKGIVWGISFQTDSIYMIIWRFPFCHGGTPVPSSSRHGWFCWLLIPLQMGIS